MQKLAATAAKAFGTKPAAGAGALSMMISAADGPLPPLEVPEEYLGRGKGTIDPEKLIAAAGRLQRLVEKENEEREKRLKELAEARQQLETSIQKLQETLDEDARIGEDWRASGCPVTSPTVIMKPLRLKPARR